MSTFDSFLRRRAVEAWRLALVVGGDEATAEQLLREAARHTAAVLPDLPGDWARALAVLTVRAYLSEGYRLGRPVAADVDTARDPDGDTLEARIAASSTLQRAVLVLHDREHLTAAEVADVVGSTPEGIETYLAAVRERLGVGRRYTEQDLRRALHVFGVESDADAGAVVDRLLHGLFGEDGRGTPPQPATSGCGDEVVAPVEPPVTPPVAHERTPAVHDYFDGDWAAFAAKQKRRHGYPSQRLLRVLVTLMSGLGLFYLSWRWTNSVNWSVWWIAVPLVLAETYSLIDSMLFGLTMWNLEQRPDPGPPPPGASVDVFITTYNEPLDLVMATARAAQAITYPHTLWILDDGNRPELRSVAEAEGIEVISRGADWIDMPRHAKAGNLNNALMVTQGEFIVILDADQVPAPNLLDRTLGYFTDERMAIVQTPQFFVNVPDSDPLGSQAPLFYGPIQAGKDGWNAAFFCGSNAVLRREALLNMGVRRYVQDLEARVTSALRSAEKVIRKAGADASADNEEVGAALASVLDAARQARNDLRYGAPIGDATHAFQASVRRAARRVVEADVAMSSAELADLSDLAADLDGLGDGTGGLSDEALDRLSRRDWSPLAAIEDVRELVAAVDVDREDEAQPIMPLSTISVTEDMATCMRIHGMGWKSAYHDEILAVGLAPEDLGTMLTQRLRWAQGTVQVMLRENPLRQRGLSWPQRLMYAATGWSYFSGLAALAYIAAPVIYLIFGILPVQALSTDFFARLIPFLIVNQLLFLVIGRGHRTWRGQQYSLALFPVWIKSVTSAVGNVVLGRSLSFAVTPKVRPSVEKLPWRLVKPQLIVMGVLVFAAGIGLTRYFVGQASAGGTIINLIWVCFQLAIFSVIVRAVLYRGYDSHHAHLDAAPVVVSPSTVSPSAGGTPTLQETSR